MIAVFFLNLLYSPGVLRSTQDPKTPFVAGIAVLVAVNVSMTALIAVLALMLRYILIIPVYISILMKKEREMSSFTSSKTLRLYLFQIQCIIVSQVEQLTYAVFRSSTIFGKKPQKLIGRHMHTHIVHRFKLRY